MYITSSRRIARGKALLSTYALLGNACLLFKYGFIKQGRNLYSTTVVPASIICCVAMSNALTGNRNQGLSSLRERIDFLRSQRRLYLKDKVWSRIQELFLGHVLTDDILNVIEPFLSADYYSDWDEFLDDCFVISYDADSTDGKVSQLDRAIATDISEGLWEAAVVFCMSKTQFKAYQDDVDVLRYLDALHARRHQEDDHQREMLKPLQSAVSLLHQVRLSSL